MTNKKEMKQAKGFTTVEKPGKKPETSEIVIEERETDHDLCNVGYTLATTINTGNYENVKAQVSLFVPCEPYEVGDVFDTVKKWVDDRLNAVVDEIREEAGL